LTRGADDAIMNGPCLELRSRSCCWP